MKLKKVLEDTVLADITVTDRDKSRFLEGLGRPYKKKRTPIKLYLASVIAASILTVLVFSSMSGEKSITDPTTSVDIPEIDDLVEGMELEHYLSDNMDRGNHDFYDELVVVDTRVKDFSRGDIVYYKGKDGMEWLTRIVGLEGEILEVMSGQVYIDNKRLDTFYGKAHRLGLDKEAYFPAMDKLTMQYNREGMMELFETNMPEIEVGKNHFYGMSDDWMRGTHGLISKEQIIGKVVGIRSK
ncbi:S26 family signal peptidase [Bacillus sp. THAF10]|uniref:S26 family signal peptidase n=1 Tax=Bacillus sp. THAF10 TaxID=2587848 RepID=UPI0020A66C9D|nr:S26 family signal peptidase [Bacillus sp. THAF10]